MPGTYDAGVARAAYELEARRALQTQIQLIKNYETLAKVTPTRAPIIPAPQIPKAPGGSGAPRSDAGSILARANAEARLAQIQNTGANATRGLAEAERIYQAALAKVDPTSTQAIRAQTQLQAVRNRLASQAGGGLPVLPRTVESFGTEALDQIKSGLLGVVGPAALVTAGFAAVSKAIDLTEEGFKLKAALDTTTASVKSQLQGFRDANGTYAEAIAFGRKYNFTQAETGAILRDSIGTLRNSTASVTELETALLRLQSKDVSKPISEASRALAELESGDVTSIKELFRVSAKDALAMRDAIVAGGDSVQVLTAYLDRTQTGMRALELRTQGATGKMNALKVETEAFMLALGGQAGGPGEFILDARIAATANATRVLSGDTKTLTADLQALAGALNPVAAITNTVSTSNEFAIQKFNELTGSAIPPTFFSINGLTEAWNRFTGAVESSPSNIPGSQRIKEELQGITRDANAAADAVAAALGNKPLPHLTDKGPSVGGANKSVLEGLFGGGAATIKQFKKDADEAEKLADLLVQNRLIKAKDSAAKIAILQGQLAKTTSAVERQQLQNQIDQERQAQQRTVASNKGITADTRADLKLIEDKQSRLNEINRLLSEGHQTELATKQLKIEQADLEREISDEVDKRNRASVDAALGIVQDAQARLKEAREAAGLERQLQSGRFSESQQNTARLRLEEIQLEQQKRALDIQRDTKAAGVAPPSQLAAPQIGAPAITQPLPLPSLGQLPPQLPPIGAPVVNLSLTIQLDPVSGRATVVNAPAGVNILDVLVRTAPGGG